MQNERCYLGRRKYSIRSHRIFLVIRDCRQLLVTGVNGAEQTQEIKMQHCTQCKSLTLDHLVVVACELYFRILKVFKKKITVKYEGIRLVPCLVKTCPPIWSTVFVFRKIRIVSPDGIIRSNDIGSSHNLDHLHGERPAIEHIAVKFYVDSVQILHES